MLSRRAFSGLIAGVPSLATAPALEFLDLHAARAGQGQPAGGGLSDRRNPADRRRFGGHGERPAPQRRPPVHGVPAHEEVPAISVEQRAESLRPEIVSLAGAKPVTEIKTFQLTVAETLKGIPEVIEQWRDTFGG